MEAIERAAFSANNPSKKQPKDTPPTATSLATFTQACCYCQQDHLPEHCASVTHPDARKQILRKVGRCLVCLRKGHISKSCRSNLKCSRCSGKHHSSICSSTAQNASPSESVSRSEKDKVASQAPGLKPHHLSPVTPKGHPHYLLDQTRLHCCRQQGPQCTTLRLH